MMPPPCRAEGEGGMAWLWALLFFGGTIAMLVTQGGDAALASMIAGASGAVTLCLELAGGYLLFMGLMGVAKRAGLLDALTKRLGGMTRWLFPNAGAAAGALALAIAVTSGRGNAATPGTRGVELTSSPANGVTDECACSWPSTPRCCIAAHHAHRCAARRALRREHRGAVADRAAAATITAVALCRAHTSMSWAVHRRRCSSA